MRRRFLPLLLLAFQSTGFAESMPVPEALEAGRAFGNDGLQQSQDLSTNQSADTVPGYQGTNVPETQYADNPMAIEDTARTQVNQNETGAFISESATSRPQFQFDKENDPLFTRSAAIEENPQSVAGNITGEFSGCQSSTISTPPTYREETCNEWRTTEASTCDRVLNIVVDQQPPNMYLARVEVGAYVTDRGVFEIKLDTGEIVSQQGLGNNGSVLQCFDSFSGETWCPQFYSSVTQNLAFPQQPDVCASDNTVTVTSSCSLWDPGNQINGFLNNRMDWSASCYVSNQPSCANDWTATFVVDDDGGRNWFKYGAVFNIQVRVQEPPLITDTWDNQCASQELRAQ